MERAFRKRFTRVSQSGVGEVGLSPVAPAIANAVARLTGTPVRQLPMLQRVWAALSA